MKRGILLALICGIQISVFSQTIDKTEQEQIEEAIHAYFTTMWDLEQMTYVEDFNKRGPNSSSYLESEVLQKYCKYDLDKIRIKAGDKELDCPHGMSEKVNEQKAEVLVYFDTYEQGNFSHCGEKNFKLVKGDGKWQIKSVESLVHPEVCPDFFD